MRRLFAGSLLTVAVVVAPGLGRAAFPGANGRLAYVRIGPQGPELVVSDASGKGERVLGPRGVVAAPAWSPDGRRIAFVGPGSDDVPGGAGSRIFVVNADGKRLRTLTAPPPGAADHDPDWSPDGSRIVFDRRYVSPIVAPPRPLAPELWLVDADGSDARRLASNGRSPAWSADGRTLAFVVAREVGPASISTVWVMKADGTGRRHLARSDSSREDAPDWSPDGRRVVYVDGGRLVTVPPSGGEPKVLTAGQFPDSDPAYSPDGKRIVFVRDFLTRGAPTHRLLMMSSGGGSQQLIAFGVSAERLTPDWQPRKLAR